MDDWTKALLRQRRNHDRRQLSRRWCWLIPVMLWVLSFSLLWRYNISGDFILVSDTRMEYEVYQQVINTGTIDVESHELLNSALMTTAFPAWLQRLTGIDPLWLFKYYVLLIFPFLPVVLWLIFRRFIGNLYAGLATLAIIAQPHYLWSPSMARVTMSLLFVAIALLIVITKPKWKYPLLGATAVLVVLSHYGTTFLLIAGLAGVAVLWAIWSWCRRHWNFVYMKLVLFLLIVTLVCSFVWHDIMFQRPAGYGKQVLADVVTPPGTYPRVEVAPRYDTKAPEVTETAPSVSFFSFQSRDPVLQVAFGATWPAMNAAQRVEFMVSWLVIMALTYGVYRIARRKNTRFEVKASVIAAYVLCLAGVVYPAISVSYGIARVYYFSSLALAPCFVVGTMDIARRTRLPPYAIASTLSLLYFLATTGILHGIMGLSRSGG